MPKDFTRPSFPTSSTDFALPVSSASSPVATSSTAALDDSNYLLQRFRRPSLLVPKISFLSESRLHSPLASSFTLHSRRRSHSTMVEDAESDKEKMITDGSLTSYEVSVSKVSTNKDESKGRSASRPPLTPPRRRPSTNTDLPNSFSPMPGRRLTFALKPPRILNLLTESRPEEDEVKSEAAFQRLINSCSELPFLPRTPRIAADRGRYPEEACQDEFQREEVSSDDEDGTQVDETPFAFSTAGGSEPIAINARSLAGNVSGDDLGMSTSESSSLGANAMDIDLVGRLFPEENPTANVGQPHGSPSISSSMSTPMNHWRHTPPPTTSVVRSNKRKLEDRFDPYPSASKRRAVSPSMSYLRESHSAVGSPITSRNGRLPVSISVNIPGSSVSSATSSPTIAGSYPSSLSRPVSMTSSPTLRSSMISGSPILRPVPRYGMNKRGEEDEREIQGAGDAVGGLTLE